jgi:hypothetical protein
VTDIFPATADIISVSVARRYSQVLGCVYEEISRTAGRAAARETQFFVVGRSASSVQLYRILHRLNRHRPRSVSDVNTAPSVRT